MAFGTAIPILPARDLAETRAFYERLRFETGYWSPGSEGYAVLRRDDLEIHFFAHETLVPSENYAGCYWRVDDADALHQECLALGLGSEGAPSLTAIVDRAWEMREFELIDPNGNVIRIGQELAAA